MAPTWFSGFLENDSVLRASRLQRCRSVLLKRSIFCVPAPEGSSLTTVGMCSVV